MIVLFFWFIELLRFLNKVIMFMKSDFKRLFILIWYFLMKFGDVCNLILLVDKFKFVRYFLKNILVLYKRKKNIICYRNDNKVCIMDSRIVN